MRDNDVRAEIPNWTRDHVSEGKMLQYLPKAKSNAESLRISMSLGDN